MMLLRSAGMVQSLGSEVATVTVRYSRKSGVCSTEVADELVLLDIDSGSYYAFSKSARAIWELLDAPRTVEDLTGELTQRFAVDAAQCSAQTVSFIQHLQDNELVEAVAQG